MQAAGGRQQEAGRQTIDVYILLRRDCPITERLLLHRPFHATFGFMMLHYGVSV